MAHGWKEARGTVRREEVKLHSFCPSFQIKFKLSIASFRTQKSDITNKFLYSYSFFDLNKSIFYLSEIMLQISSI